MRGLYRARFGYGMPMVGVRGGVVTFRYPRILACDWFGYRAACFAEVELNADIPGDVQVRGGASKLTADLRGLRLGSFDLEGGANRLEVVLSPPPRAPWPWPSSAAPATSPSSAPQAWPRGFV